MAIKYLEFLIQPLTPTVLIFHHADFFLGQFNNSWWHFFYSSLFSVPYFTVKESFKIKENYVFFLEGESK